MKYIERQELNELSLKVFGVSSKWNTLTTKGVYENGKQKYYTVDEIKALMTERLANRSEKTIEEIATDLNLDQAPEVPAVKENV